MIYNIPGLRNSGPDHWQSLWEKKYPDMFRRIHQHNWQEPEREAWIQEIEQVLQQEELNNTILTGHSVGCAAIVHWVQAYGHVVKGALLVAPSDVDHQDYPTYIKGFSPMPLEKLPFKTIVVASTNDHVVSPERAKYFADCWGSELIVLKDAGHIEGKAGYGAWEEGLKLLFRLQQGQLF